MRLNQGGVECLLTARNMQCAKGWSALDLAIGGRNHSRHAETEMPSILPSSQCRLRAGL